MYDIGQKTLGDTIKSAREYANEHTLYYFGEFKSNESKAYWQETYNAYMAYWED